MTSGARETPPRTSVGVLWLSEVLAEQATEQREPRKIVYPQYGIGKGEEGA
jgi:hypothetical protein